MKQLCISVLFLTTCSAPPPRIECGPGTKEQGGVCVAEAKSQPTTEEMLSSGLEGKLTTKTTSFIWQSIPAPVENTLFDMSKYGNDLFISGENGTILKSVDQGRVWEPVALETTEHLYDMSNNGKDLFACGAKGTILRSKDGIKWENISPPDIKDLLDISAGEKNVITVGQAGTIITSDNNGEEWHVQMSVTDATLSDSVTKNDDIYAVGSGGVVVHSKDRGLSWESTKIGRKDLIAVRSSNKSIYIIADDGTTYRLAPDGEWKEILGGTTHRLLDVWDINGFFAVGYDGVILQSEGFGKPWEEQQSGTPNSLFGAFGLSDKRFALGDNGLILVFEPWNLWVSNKSQVPLRLRAGNTATVIPPKGTSGIIVAADNKRLEYIDEDANVLELPFQLESSKKYKMICAAGPTKKLECQDPTTFPP
jgi:photosystem II stability/assembly factor-like uncharacterized protein